MSYTQYKDSLLARIRQGEKMTGSHQLALAAVLSVPSMLAQLVHILMQYIDASMVGSLGAKASASIGIVSTTLWLFGSLCSSASVGFYVQVAHRIGAGDLTEARHVLRQSFISCITFAVMLSNFDYFFHILFNLFFFFQEGAAAETAAPKRYNTILL